MRTDGQTDKGTDMKGLIVAFRNFARVANIRCPRFINVAISVTLIRNTVLKKNDLNDI
jgi:hypothetical protein